MEKLMKKSQSLKLLPIVALLIITPLLSTSLRFKYLYFIVNILIIAVGAEAGLFSFSLQSATEDKKQTPGRQQPPPTISEASPAIKEKKSRESDNGIKEEEPIEKLVKDVEKIPSNKIFVEVKVNESPSTSASIFFIGGGDESGAAEEEEEAEDLEKEDVNEGDQELFHKAESFIGNFYKQLKMQREDSSNKLHHHLSQKAF